MELSEAEIEARLSDLRRRREALDREIADHVLYLELGRRLRGAGPAPAQSEERASELHEPPEAVLPRAPAAIRTMPAAPEPPQRVPVAFEVDPAGARRYGRALIEAACGILVRAGRPMHAGEILEALVAEGFAVPGQDPVAALNTRLWKRSGPHGSLRRLGDAVYAPALGAE
ncbi:hypothetical protein [Methylobacterium sp. WL8]|uniref:hypothetical protein n=1 Tax=Methylobacterium sp. WL8 TaxID=2603899 RepID=UPI0011C84FB0|nr:hypothetical protein [Methylobacterium sp. WL8]TXN81837.1 hypothetical protein FV234_12115 [Methylobacterium sp. WL8]